MIDKPSPSFEVELQKEFKRFYLAGVETGRKREREVIDNLYYLVSKAQYTTEQLTVNKCHGYCHQAKNGEIFSCSCLCCK